MSSIPRTACRSTCCSSARRTRCRSSSSISSTSTGPSGGCGSTRRTSSAATPRVSSRYETATTVPTSRRGVMFAHRARLRRGHAAVHPPGREAALVADGNGPEPLGAREIRLQTYLGDTATRIDIGGDSARQAAGPPALLVSGRHGIECPPDDPRQRETQGALVCQDWTGFGAITEEHWFAAADVPADARLQGMIHFFFACYGGGCTELDDFDRLNKQPRRIADKPFLSRLPQTLLAHPNGGALAVLAHVERAWAYSFQGQRGGSQMQGFRDVIGRLLRGERIGQATDTFNMRWAALSTELSEMQPILHTAPMSRSRRWATSGSRATMRAISGPRRSGRAAARRGHAADVRLEPFSRMPVRSAPDQSSQVVLADAHRGITEQHVVLGVVALDPGAGRAARSVGRMPGAQSARWRWRAARTRPHSASRTGRKSQTRPARRS